MLSIHDNNVFAYTVECKSQRLTLHTQYQDRELTDVIFSGVVAHHFNHVLSGNILFGIEDLDPATVVDDEADQFAESWKWGWPPIEYEGDLTVLKRALHDHKIRGYEIDGSYGLNGWVLAVSCKVSEGSLNQRLKLPDDDRPSGNEP